MRILSRQVSSLEKQKMSLEEEVKAKSLKTNDTVKVRSAGYPDLTRPQLYDPAFYDKQCDEPWVPPYRKYRNPNTYPEEETDNESEYKEWSRRTIDLPKLRPVRIMRADEVETLEGLDG